jgi:type IX secretion system PorP/SprF family membrane protein
VTFGIQSDPSLMNIEGGITANVGAGVYFQNKKLSLSFSIPRILRPKRLEKDGDLAILGRNKLHMYLMAAYDIELNENLVFKPSSMIRYIENAPWSIDLTTALNYKQLLELGVGYRLEEGVAGFCIFNLSNSFRIGYAYEAPLSSLLNNTSNGTHELFLKLQL